MDSKTDQHQLLLQAILPKEVFEYFEILKVDIDSNSIDVYLDELNQPPVNYKDEILISKGFHESVAIQDFPIRRRAVYLHVRRRKWLIRSTGKIISNQFDLSSKGTRYTKDFASFLKGLLR